MTAITHLSSNSGTPRASFRCQRHLHIHRCGDLHGHHCTFAWRLAQRHWIAPPRHTFLRGGGHHPALPRPRHRPGVRGALRRPRHLLGVPAHAGPGRTPDHGVRRTHRHRRIRPSSLASTRIHPGAVQPFPGTADQPSRRPEGAPAGAFARRVRRRLPRDQPPRAACRGRPLRGRTGHRPRTRGGGEPHGRAVRRPARRPPRPARTCWPLSMPCPACRTTRTPWRSPVACCRRTSPTTGATRRGWPRSGTRCGPRSSPGSTRTLPPT